MLLKKDGIYRDVPEHKLSEYKDKGYTVVNKEKKNNDKVKNNDKNT